jgi:hypothetical protein
MSINKIGLDVAPVEYTKIYRGQYNGIRYNIMYNKTYDKEYGDTDYSVDIIWVDHLDEERKEIVNQAIIKLFKSKIEQQLIIKD